MKMIRRPVITYYGDENLFNSLRSGLVSSLPQETVEWRRTYVQLTRSVHVEVDFAPFSDKTLSKESTQGILGSPIFHTFWTDCPDIEAYKASVRDILQTWVQNLKLHGCSDWMVVLVETPDTKKSNKLIPRTTLLDKLKNDFGGKQSERYISLIDPSKSDSRSLESWQNFIFKMRQLIMIAYNRAVNKFEDSMRIERERRIEKTWSFCKYFLMQEELAQVFSLLSLSKDALVQYDELDALFTQFVLNSAAGETPYWLSTFSQTCDKWEGLFLSPKVRGELKQKITDKTITLLEFRNYLFHCQCVLLMQLDKPWELAARSLSFLQNTIAELRILDVNIANGGTACWGFLSCLEVINFLYKHKEPATTDLHALHTAPLWAFARDKLKELGYLCGLMPGCDTNSDQLHTVISLVYGMGDDPHTNDEPTADQLPENENSSVHRTPMTLLKEALSSKEAFKKDFLDLSEVAISTYKHIGRIRSARLIGRDLALFYLKEGSPHLAASFLSDQLKTFLEEGWDLLSLHTQLDLIKCYELMQDTEKLIRMCIHLSANQVSGYDSCRQKAFNDMMEAASTLSLDKPLCIPTKRIFEVGPFKLLSSEPFILGSVVDVEVVIQSFLPASLQCKRVEIQLRHYPEVPEKHDKHPHHRSSKGGTDIERKYSTSSTSSQASSTRRISSQSTHSTRSVSESGEPPMLRHSRISQMLEEEYESESDGVSRSNPRLHMNLNLDYKQDKSLSTASIICENAHKVFRRRDSHGGLESFEKSVSKETVTDSLILEDIQITPGRNVLQLSTKISKKGSFVGGQVVLETEKLHFVCGKSFVQGPPLILDIVNESPHIFLGRKDKELLAGVIQSLVLTVKSGSSVIKEGSKIKLRASRGLQLLKDPPKTEELCAEGQEGRDDSEDPDHESDAMKQTVDEAISAHLFSKEIELVLPAVKPFDKEVITLGALAELIPQKDASTIEHLVTITSPLMQEPRLDIDIHFIPPFMSSHKLHSANLKKFIQITITGLVSQSMELTDPLLKFVDAKKALPLKFLNFKDQKLTVRADYSASYMWELDANYTQEDSSPSKLAFTIDYSSPEDPLREKRTYSSSFDIHNYKTLYTVRARVEPSKGSEFCRAGNMCHLHITLVQVDHTANKEVPDENKEEESSPHSSLTDAHNKSIMYEVIAEQNMWALCGSTSGVLTLDPGAKQNVVLDVMPLITGFLPLPSVRLSKYIPAETKLTSKDGKKVSIVGTASSVPRLEPFSTGQVYNFSKAMQVHVLPAVHTAPSSDMPAG